MRAIGEIWADYAWVDDKPHIDLNILSAAVDAAVRLAADIPDLLDALTEKDAKIERLEAALIEAREPVSDATAALIAATLQRGTPVLWEKER